MSTRTDCWGISLNFSSCIICLCWKQWKATSHCGCIKKKKSCELFSALLRVYTWLCCIGSVPFYGRINGISKSMVFDVISVFICICHPEMCSKQTVNSSYELNVCLTQFASLSLSLYTHTHTHTHTHTYAHTHTYTHRGCCRSQASFDIWHQFCTCVPTNHINCKSFLNKTQLKCSNLNQISLFQFFLLITCTVYIPFLTNAHKKIFTNWKDHQFPPNLGHFGWN